MNAIYQMPYYLGGPVWSVKEWVGDVFASDTKSSDYLQCYSTIFNTVEGNSFFYAMPGLDIVRRWASHVSDGFRFSPKFPKAISHECQLKHAGRETEAFFQRLQIFHEAECLGPSFLQLPPFFGPDRLSILEHYLRGLPKAYPFAVEVRHPDFLGQGQAENELNALLSELKIDRVIFDSRPLFSAEPTNQHEEKAQGRKPKIPVHRTVTAKRPMLRLVGKSDLQGTMPWINEWASIVAQWLKNDLTPYIFIHTPNDVGVPVLARMFHEVLSQHYSGLSPLPDFPGELEKRELKKRPQQLDLF